MNACLILESNARPPRERHILNEARIETELACKGGFFAECIGSIAAGLAAWRVQVGGSVE